MHKTTVRVEQRHGMRIEDFRATCTCGWQEKAASHVQAAIRGKTHESQPHRK
jgi:hypothetical protein